MNRSPIIATYWFASSSGAGNYETLVYADGTTSCACPGWTRRVDKLGQRSCKHTRMVEAGIGPSNCIKYNVHPDHQTTTSPPRHTVTPTPKLKPKPIKPPVLGHRKFLD